MTVAMLDLKAEYLYMKAGIDAAIKTKSSGWRMIMEESPRNDHASCQ